MDYQKKAEEVLARVWGVGRVEWKYDGVELDILAAALEQAYKEGVEACVAILEEQMGGLRPEARVNYPKAVALDRAIKTCSALLSPAKGESK